MVVNGGDKLTFRMFNLLKLNCYFTYCMGKFSVTHQRFSINFLHVVIPGSKFSLWFKKNLVQFSSIIHCSSIDWWNFVSHWCRGDTRCWVGRPCPPHRQESFPFLLESLQSIHDLQWQSVTYPTGYLCLPIESKLFNKNPKFPSKVMQNCQSFCNGSPKFPMTKDHKFLLCKGVHNI